MNKQQDWVFKNPPFDHQLKGFIDSRDKEAYALLWEQGLGKTFALVNNAAWLAAKGKVDGVLIIAPNGLTRVWVEQFEEHCPDFIQYSAAVYKSQPNKAEGIALNKTLEYVGLVVVAINVEALATAKGVDFCKKFVNTFDTIMILDESTSIKNPKAVRTKNILKLAPIAKYRRIANGTPVTNSPLDIYCQFKFLDETILRTSSYYAFRNRYAITKSVSFDRNKRPVDMIVGYQNLEELTELIQPHSSRLLKKDCLDLPEKLYAKRYIQLSPAQRQLYNTLKKDLVAEFAGSVMSAPLALTKLLRLQQITGGLFVPDEEFSTNLKPSRIDKVNPRVETLMDILETTEGSVIIWARFREEIAWIVERITEVYGKDSVVEYHGGVDNETRQHNIKKFQSKQSRFFVGNTQSGGKGLTLTAANTMVFFSNTFSLEERLQAADRCHRIGTTQPVLYIDLIAENTLDEKIVSALRDKKTMADVLINDPIEKWI